MPSTVFGVPCVFLEEWSDFDETASEAQPAACINITVHEGAGAWQASCPITLDEKEAQEPAKPSES